MLAADWDTVIKRALAKKPEHRFQTARQFADAIRFVMEGKALPKAPEFLNDATVQVPGGMKAQRDPTVTQAAPRTNTWVIFAFGAAAVAAAAVALTLHFTRREPVPAPAPVAAAQIPKPAPVVVEPPKPEPVAEKQEAQPAPPPPAPKEKLKQRIAEKKAERRAAREISEPPPMAFADEKRAPKPVVPAFRGKVVSLDRSWGFAVVELAERGSVKVGDRLTATMNSGRRMDMVVRRISGNLASAVPDGKLSDDLVGASVTRN
jgi:type IV secretory pathway VirB10-like protein